MAQNEPTTVEWPLDKTGDSRRLHTRGLQEFKSSNIVPMGWVSLHEAGGGQPSSLCPSPKKNYIDGPKNTTDTNPRARNVRAPHFGKC